MVKTKPILKIKSRTTTARKINDNFLTVQKKFMGQVEKYGNVYLTLLVSDPVHSRLCCIKDLPDDQEELLYLAERISFDLRQMRNIYCLFVVFSWQPEQRARGYHEFIVIGKRANGDVRYCVKDYKVSGKKVSWLSQYSHEQSWSRVNKLPASLRNNISYRFLDQLYTAYNVYRLMNFKK